MAKASARKLVGSAPGRKGEHHWPNKKNYIVIDNKFESYNCKDGGNSGSSGGNLTVVKDGKEVFSGLLDSHRLAKFLREEYDYATVIRESNVTIED